MTIERSGRLYSVVTKHWAKIATALVGVLGLIELLLGGLTADSSVEFYLMAWAGTTGGLWFLFEKAEKTLSEESRVVVAARLGSSPFWAPHKPLALVLPLHVTPDPIRRFVIRSGHDSDQKIHL